MVPGGKPFKVLDPIQEDQITVLLHPGGVSGDVPAVFDGLTHGFFVFIVPRETRGAAHLQSSDLWSRAYFVRQAHKVGPNTVTAICNVLDRQRIEAQGYRSCQNILALAKGDNKALLERACGQLIDDTSPRAISYTAVKQHLGNLYDKCVRRHG